MTDTEGQHRAAPQGLLERINLSEPVRLRLWALTTAVVAILVGYGVLDEATAALWSAVPAALLGITATEAVRSAVVSPTTARRAATDAVEAAAQTPMHPMRAAQLALGWNGIPHT